MNTTSRSQKRPSSLVVIGAAGTGREVLDIADAINQENERSCTVVGIIDDNPSPVHLERLAHRGVPYLGTLSDWLSSAVTHHFAVGIADPATREHIAERMIQAGHLPASLIHPRAAFGSEVKIGEGAIVYDGVRLTTNVTVGNFAVLNAGANIGHDVRIDNFVTVNPVASISGEVHVQSHCLIGGGATVLQGLTVGNRSLVGARALVTKHVPPGVTVKGVPGRW